jgi:DNA invertase Pin-like site-specific DNA recombinase
MRVTSEKSRVRESRLPGSVRAKPNGRATRPLTSAERRAKIEEALQASPEATQKELARQTGVSRSTVGRVLRAHRREEARAQAG